MRWLAYFYLYCFIGWCMESAIVSISQRRLSNRGFMKGPFLPIYGFGAVAMAASGMWITNHTQLADSVWLHVGLVFLSGMVSATLLELAAGILIENVFKMKYWDYSGKFCNFKGYICLKSSVFWGFLTILLVFFIHEPIAAFVRELPAPLLTGAVGALSVLLLLDFLTSFKEAFDVQKFLAYQTKVQEEVEEIRSRLAEARRSLADTRENIMVRRGRLEELIREQEIRKDKLMEELGRRKELAKLGLRRLKNYPTAYSKRFGKTFSEWKETLKDKL